MFGSFSKSGSYTQAGSNGKNTFGTFADDYDREDSKPTGGNIWSQVFRDDEDSLAEAGERQKEL